MPEGQYSGARAAYEYQTDTGDTYLVVLDETLGDLAEVGLVKAANDSTATECPKRFSPRYVNWVGELNSKPVRKSLVCAIGSDAYDDKSISIEIDGVTGTTTGRVGEKKTYVRLPAASPSP